MKSSFNAFVKLGKVKQLARADIHPLTYQQKSQGMKGKVESVIQRLGRLDVEDSITGDQDESKLRIILFECVFSTYHERLPTLMQYQGSRRDQGRVAAHFGTI